MAPIWILAALAPAGCDDGDFDRDGFVEPLDCDDGDANAHPGAEEVPYDGKDQDCDGADLVDRDRDGFQGQQAGGPDCNDFDASVYPGAEDEPYDDLDADCDDWDDDDFDHDGFVAMGHGGEDCDDTDARITPLDTDGDGYSPCTGDCDEGDPLRNEEAEPVCGNGFDDDCDDISDCTPTGVVRTVDLPLHLTGDDTVHDFGARVAVPGDLDGDGIPDLVVLGNLGPDDTVAPTTLAATPPDSGDTGGDTGSAPPPVEDGARAWLFASPLPAESGPATAWSTLTFQNDDPTVSAIGDVDGDGAPDLAFADLTADNRVWVVTAWGPGDAAVEDVARLTLVGSGGEQVGRTIARLDDRLVVGAPLGDRLQLLAADTTGVRAFGEDGAVLTGPPGTGMGVHGGDTDGDGALELFVTASGDPFPSRATLYRVPDPPTAGTAAVQDVSYGTIDLTPLEQSPSAVTTGDLDDDGQGDVVVSVPFAQGAVGAVGVFRSTVTDALDFDAADTQVLGLGDDTAGWVTLAEDFDGDGIDDLTVAAPAAWGSIGSGKKPGAVHLWYGPVPDGVEHTVSADLYLEGEITGVRTYTGHGVALGDVDGDGGTDLVVGAPNDGTGAVDVLPGGLTGLYGF